MRLFLRDHLLLFAFYVQQLLFIILLFYLEDYKNYAVYYQAACLSLGILCFYLFCRYVSHRLFYQRLQQPLQQPDAVAEHLGSSVLCQALQKLLRGQFRLYQQELLVYERQQKRHLVFIHQWVHQMKTPLSVIHLVAQEGGDERWDSVREEVDRLSRGLDMVLYTARLDSFTHDFHVGPVPLKKLLARVVSENKYLFSHRQVFPLLEVDPTLAVESDAKWLRFIFTQIFTNAVRYTQAKGKKIICTATLHKGQPTEGGGPAEDTLVVSVKDEGIGIPQADIHRVFAPYYTGSNGRKVGESTGMGLYLVSEVCKRLGHGVELASEVGKGTTVSLRFHDRSGRHFAQA